jgi:hypothetical protein
MLSNDNCLKTPSSEGYNKKRFEIWSTNMQNWEKKRKKKIVFLKEKMENEQIFFEKNFPFNPKLNTSFSGFSRSFVEENTQDGQTRFDRMHKDNNYKMAKIEKIKADLTPSFEPKINNTIPKFLRNSSAHNVKSRNLKNDFIKNRSTSMTNTRFSTKGGKPRKNNQKVKAIQVSKSFDLEEQNNKHLSKLIDKMSNLLIPNKNKSDVNLYSINSQNNLSWQKSKESCLVYTPKFSQILSNLTRNKSYDNKTSSDVNNSIQYDESFYESKKNIQINQSSKV